MGPLGWELVDVVARWIHVIAGIMWVGNSLLFNWLDRNLQKPGPRSAPGSIGEIWLLHSGAFYYVDKTLLGDQKMPKPMHWFFVQAYTTAVSGVVLLIAVYWAGNRAVLEDTTVAQLTHAQAVFVGLGAIVLGNILYQLSNRMVAPKAPRLSAIIWISGLVAISLALTQLLNGRAAFLHVGAMIGIIMAENVAHTILPSQRALIKSIDQGAGAAESKALSDRAKRVSIHNNYFTFPVIFLMVSSHFPGLYSNRLSWLILLVIIAVGALVRHIMNIRFTWSPWRPALAATGIGGMVLLIAAMHLGNSGITILGPALRPDLPDSVSFGPVNFADVRHVVDRRCAVCHSSRPADLSFGVAPGGVAFDTPEQIVAHRERILQRAVLTRTMPPSNKTRITDSERAILRAWTQSR